MLAGAARRLPLLALLALLSSAGLEGLKLELSAGHQECASLYVSERQLQVSGVDGAVASFRGEVAGPPVDIALHDPKDTVLWQHKHASDDFAAAVLLTGPGSYRLCFEAHGHHVQPPVVDVGYFMLTHQQATEVHVPKGSEDHRSMRMARREHLVPVQQQMAQLGEVAELLLREQDYLKHRLDRHHRTNVSTQRRNTVYTALEMTALVAVSLLQVFTIRHLFLSHQAQSRTNV